jgi:hypothetical protein
MLRRKPTSTVQRKVRGIGPRPYGRILPESVVHRSWRLDLRMLIVPELPKIGPTT